MDKAKEYLALAQKHHFWVVSGLVLGAYVHSMLRQVGDRSQARRGTGSRRALRSAIVMRVEI